MGKLLSWILLAFAGWLVWKFVVISQRKAGRSGSGGAAPPPPGDSVEKMVSCAHCGVHVPASEAVVAGSLSYCCAAHRDAHAGQPGT
jgi:uncharacterized protein